MEFSKHALGVIGKRDFLVGNRDNPHMAIETTISMTKDQARESYSGRREIPGFAARSDDPDWRPNEQNRCSTQLASASPLRLTSKRPDASSRRQRQKRQARLLRNCV